MSSPFTFRYKAKFNKKDAWSQEKSELIYKYKKQYHTSINHFKWTTCSYFIDSSFLTLTFSLSKSLSTSQLFYYSDSILTVSFFATLSLYFYLHFYRFVVLVAFDKRLQIDSDFRINSEDANDIHALSSTWKFSWFFHHFLRLAKIFKKIWK